MRIKLQNAKILVNTYTPVFEGEVCIEKDRIIYVGQNAMEGEFDRVIDCKGNLLMSSFCNAHAHAAMSLPICTTILKVSMRQQRMQIWHLQSVVVQIPIQTMMFLKSLKKIIKDIIKKQIDCVIFRDYMQNIHVKSR